MTTDNYITIILWILGVLGAVFAYFFVKYDKWAVLINKLLSELKTGQEITHVRLQHIEADMSYFKTNADKVRFDLEQNHTEIKTIKADLENLKKDFDKWETKR